MKQKLVCSAILLGCILFMSNSAFALTFTGSSSGIFENPVGPAGMVVTGVGTSNFTWGDGTPYSSPPSSLQYSGTAFSVDEEVVFQLGTLTYYNGTVSPGTQADSVDLDVLLTFTTPSGLTEDFLYNLNLINTPNTSDPTASADYVYLPSSYSGTIFNEGGTNYTLSLQFGEVTGDGFSSIDEFYVLEGAYATANLYGTITTNIVPEPATMLLLGTGLVGVAGAARRKKKNQV